MGQDQEKQPSIDENGNKKISPSETIKPSQEEKTKDEKKSLSGNVAWRVRTYKEDIAEAIRSQKTSLTSVVAAEQIKRSKTNKENVVEKEPVDLKKVSIVLGSIILAISGIVVIGYFAFFYEKEEVVIEKEIPSLMFVEEQKEVNVTGKNAREILKTLGEEKEKVGIPLGQISHLYITETSTVLDNDVTNLVSSEGFLTSIRAQLSGAFLRSINPFFMLGVHAFNQNQPFIIFQSNSYQNSFRGLLEWERTMFQDLYMFMGRKSDPIIGAPVDPKTGEKIVLRENFEDIIIKNIDVRALLSESGNIELLYAFPNQQTLIITTNENTLIEIITRLNSVRVF